MSHIVVKMKSGKVHDFPDTGRPGGSYTNRIRYEGVFAIVIDAYDKQTIFPAEDIETIETTERTRW